MAAAFNQEGIIVTTRTSPEAQAGNMNATPLEPNSRQFQQIPLHLQKFLKGEQKALGVTQIMLGIIQVTFGIAHCFSDPITRYVGMPWWTGVLYIISGALSVSLEKRPNKPLMVGSLVMNIVSTIAAAMGIILYSPWLMLNPFNGPCKEIVSALASCLLVFTILEFAISIAASVFDCHGLRCCEPDHELNSIVIQSAIAQNYPAEESQDANYETLLAHHSDYEVLTFK
ncbi:membrane-spanning 4-domains subfamily A member 4A-like [Heptranchias perlo]|uniref:membrane-spanning 4-domains subfamily A member 4A-like n=1 Tax=Heptranchias perlo TaxID=212740 RepID=UPI003559A7E9